ncbi:hypothetical protein [Sphingomonas sp.]|uniref:hypothetical protein n=1 Tax=Sphingomonas sp. TaxID=28214 RepID=UPI001AFE574A|nr:hypothetical protein [Sphingomonas sp.]MBO9714902.1 hypothetical protein [Sphingomonas sp.]
MRMMLAAGAALLMLGGCGGGSGGEAPAAQGVDPAKVAADPTIQKVLKMNDQQLKVVLVRAIMDAGMKCDGVTSAERQKDQAGLPAWLAHCRDGSSHFVILELDGGAKVLSPAGA